MTRMLQIYFFNPIFRHSFRLQRNNQPFLVSQRLAADIRRRFSFYFQMFVVKMLLDIFNDFS